MFFRVEHNRRWLAVGAVAALLFGSLGCGAEHEPKTGGANTPKAKENRKVAELSVLEGVQSGVKEQVAFHPELKKKNGLVRAEEKVMGWLGTVHVSASAPPSPTPPVAPTPPAAPKAIAFVPPQPIMTASKPEHQVRSLAPHRLTGESLSSPVVISERVVTEIPYITEAEAEARTLEDAQKLIEKRLQELDPPVAYRPSIAVVKNEYVKRDSRLVRLPTESEKNVIAQAGYSAERKYVEYTVEMTSEQVRELRTRNRVADALRGLGVLAAVSLAGFFFLRLDEWSKGYLTSWLALAAAALGGGIVAAVVFV